MTTGSTSRRGKLSYGVATSFHDFLTFAVHRKPSPLFFAEMWSRVNMSRISFVMGKEKVFQFDSVTSIPL